MTARAVGSSHQKIGAPCQDSLECELLPGGVFVAALADGAGSAKRALDGSSIAVASAHSFLKQALTTGRQDLKQILLDATDCAREAVRTEADIRQESMREYASTLLLTVLTPETGAASQIGDGVIVVGEGNGEWNWMFWPQHGQYANTTRFLVDDDYAKWLECDVFGSSVTDMAILSDGLESLALQFDTKTVHNQFFAPFFQSLIGAPAEGEDLTRSIALAGFLDSQRVRDRTDDDTSLIVATCQRYAGD